MNKQDHAIASLKIYEILDDFPPEEGISILTTLLTYGVINLTPLNEEQFILMLRRAWRLIKESKI